MSEEPKQYYASLLGTYVDGWFDLIEGMAGQAEFVRSDVAKQLAERDMPDVGIERIYIQEGITSSLKRGYIVTTVFPGVTCGVYVAKHGKDLYASWKTFIGWRINWTYMAIYAMISAVLVFVPGFLRSLSIGLGTAAMFGQGLDWEMVQDAAKESAATMGSSILAIVPFFFFILLLAMIAGAVVRRNAFAFILKEPSWFDVDNVAALNLSVHKSLLRALDAAGIDVSLLREKREFKGGRRGENV